MKKKDTFTSGEKLNFNYSDFKSYEKDSTKVTFLPSGEIFEILSDGLLVNQFLGNYMDGNISSLLLRIYKDGAIKSVYPLRGVKASSTISINNNGITYKGKAENVSYTVNFSLSGENVWFWQVNLDGDCECDVVYMQDLGMGDKGGVLTNELYLSQYLGHVVFNTENGYQVGSRQALCQGGKYPTIFQGAIGINVAHYSTDQMQFFGTEYKLTGVPKAYFTDLSDVNYQYELAYIALQTEKIKLAGQKSFAFFAKANPNHESAITEAASLAEITALYLKTNFSSSAPFITPVKPSTNVLSGEISGEDFTDIDLSLMFPTRHLEEKQNNKLLSFFTTGHAHVALKAKEALLERPHGNIVTTALKENSLPEKLLTSTHYSYGLFNSQTVMGNTSFNKLISTNRGLLNLSKFTGQRIFIFINGKYRQLNMCSAFEMGLNYSKWYYKINSDIICISAFAVMSSPKHILTLTSLSNKKYKYIVSTQLVMGCHEWENLIEYTSDGEIIKLTVPKGSTTHEFCPNLSYRLRVTDCDYSVSDDRIFFSDNVSRNGSLLTISTEETAKLTLTINASLSQEFLGQTNPESFEDERKKYLGYFASLLSDFKLEKENDQDVQKLNETAYWYAHNAMVHFSVPHGLEQPGGAAWGTRDVCQGPLEFFLTTGHFELARKVLISVFNHQLNTIKEWPQWFMFDEYPFGSGDCHGDIVFWPLKILSDYINCSGDDSILAECVPYKNANLTNDDNNVSVLDHVKTAYACIEERFIGSTGLITYAGGDWDDTLQPINAELKNNLVSSWTMALAFQTLSSLSEVIAVKDKKFAKELKLASEKIEKAFNTKLIKDGVISGFGYHHDGKTDLLLHPDDNETGIKYRLLPMTRSIIARLVSKPQAEKNFAVIQEKLACADGVRLMDTPARYEGGVSRIFARAETAANVGREISLQYVHAHIRYIEAVAALGYSDEVWKGVFAINPILITDVVKNALTRQSNAYFSSSEGLFMDRYDYKKNFHLLKDGKIPVRGGWRIYSSGGGIYLSQLIGNVLGIRFNREGLILDPVLPNKMDGLKVSLNYLGKKLEIIYKASTAAKSVKEITLNGNKISATEIKTPYRKGAALIPKNILARESGKLTITVTL